MTLCLASLAADGRAIVCVADKGVFYSGGDEIQWDTDSTKILRIGTSDVWALISGGELMLSRVLRGLDGLSDFGSDVGATIQEIEKAYHVAESQVLEAAFLHPYLAIADYIKAISKKRVNDVIKNITEKIENERSVPESAYLMCWIIFCGFDAQGNPFILYLQPPGLVTPLTHNGNAATGRGGNRAMARMLWNGWERKYSIARVLFDTMDAKFDAEMNPSVGTDFDAIIITKQKAEPLPNNIKKLVERAWKKTVRSPWDTFDPEEDIPEPPDNWKDQLEEYCHGLLHSDVSS